MTPRQLDQEMRAVVDALWRLAKVRNYTSVEIASCALVPEGELRVVFRWKPPESLEAR